MAALDRVFSAHVLATHLDPTFQSEGHMQFAEFRR